MEAETTISRRSFNKSALFAAISGLAGGSIVTRSANKTCPPIPWHLFCDSEGGIRCDLSRPFVQGGVKFATDNRIMIWSPTVEADTKKSERRMPSGNSIAEQIINATGDWHPWPEPDYRFFNENGNYQNECWCHRGKQFARICSKCEGDGGTENEYDEDGYVSGLKNCTRCGGNGDIAYGPNCTTCGGTGGPIRRAMLVGSVIIDRQYDEMIRQLGSPIEWRVAMEYVQPLAKAKTEHHCIGFRWPRGMGAVMSIIGEVE